MLVAWFTDRKLFLLAVALYGVSAVYSILLFRKGFTKDNRINYLILFAACRAFVSAGRSMPIKTAMMPMTTRSSTRVKAREAIRPVRGMCHLLWENWLINLG